ncbi:protein CURVATURE THYLAKOID 1A, chloroplastic [Lactuca sativa]|uniref:protein CURVATURE THYLAKOID 1A, chloroplastic n=1 Tax=Lactuca sativa TaxID=4236 RepID=UPI0022AFA85D|nr:protein CURVATURE THYLAKOID 1A, chloroplastic [Lactuca sativa]
MLTHTAVGLPQLPTTPFVCCSVLPHLPACSFSSSIKHVSDHLCSESIALDANELFDDLKEKWDSLENKSTVVVYGGGAVVAILISSILIGAVKSVPQLPKILELVGLGYIGWFVYQYLLLKSSRKELATNIEWIKKEIAGTE